MDINWILIILWLIAGFFDFLLWKEGKYPSWVSYWCLYIVVIAQLIGNLNGA